MDRNNLSNMILAGGGKKNSNSQYVYIEKFVKTEVLLNT